MSYSFALTYSKQEEQPPGPSQIDLLEWMCIDNRSTDYLAGTATQGAHTSFAMDTDPGYPSTFPNGVFWIIKNVAGNPWDACGYNNDFALMHWITENGDASAKPHCPNNDCWGVAIAYKRQIKFMPMIPRWFTPHSIVTIRSQPNYVKGTWNCEQAGTTTDIQLGPVRAVTSGPYNITFGGEIDSGPGGAIEHAQGVPAIKNEYFLSGAEPNERDLEVTFYVQGWGRVVWKEYQRPSGTGGWGSPTNQDIHNRRRQGTNPQPNFPCSGQSWWLTTQVEQNTISIEGP